jgi:hypothetical protein
MKKTIFVGLIGISVFAPLFAQDFLQQWRDSAIKSMNEFRATSADAIKAGGWHFVEGLVNAEGVPLADVFIKDVKLQDGTLRSAQVLSAFYSPTSSSDVPEYQSSKAVVWFDCAGGGVEQRGIERYSTKDGAGPATSSEALKPATAPREMRTAEPQTLDKSLLTAVCTAKL